MAVFAGALVALLWVLVWVAAWLLLAVDPVVGVVALVAGALVFGGLAWYVRGPGRGPDPVERIEARRRARARFEERGRRMVTEDRLARLQREDREAERRADEIVAGMLERAEARRSAGRFQTLEDELREAAAVRAPEPRPEPVDAPPDATAETVLAAPPPDEEPSSDAEPTAHALRPVGPGLAPAHDARPYDTTADLAPADHVPAHDTTADLAPADHVPVDDTDLLEADGAGRR